MYTLFRMVAVREWLGVEAPAIVIAWVIAELFYKFHSFTLECAAFLCTWLVVGWCASGLRAALNAGRRAANNQSG